MGTKSLLPKGAVPRANVEGDAASSSTGTAAATSSDALSDTAPAARGKVNEIDFCIAPADVSLSRAYGNDNFHDAAAAAAAAAASSDIDDLSSFPSPTSSSPPVLSMTRALNNASNRAVRRILLARSWPSAEALNLSLRQAAAAEKERQAKRQAGMVVLPSSSSSVSSSSSLSSSGAKCPVPRPILNVLMRRRKDPSSSRTAPPAPRSRTDEEYVADQLRAFRERYGSPDGGGAGYSDAEAYLESILSLATSGVESGGASSSRGSSSAYGEAYRRVLGVLRSVGAVLERDPETGRRRIASRLVDQDICLSVLDRIKMQQEQEQQQQSNERNDDESKCDNVEGKVSETQKSCGESGTNDSCGEKSRGNSNKQTEQLTGEDLGGVLLSAKEPSMTRQLNVLANIVQRALLFGGDQELLVLSETLQADLPAFCERWYPDKTTGGGGTVFLPPPEEETRPGVQFLNCLVRLLRDCYDGGVLRDLEPPLPLSQSYANAYERLVAVAVELGSGYLKPLPGNIITGMPKPRTAQEELGRFAVWETTFRKAGVTAGKNARGDGGGVQSSSSSSSSSSSLSPYPRDLVGTWKVRDEIGGETIGESRVVFDDGGRVRVRQPLEGLRWRLDPGPTHLDTCTFQVLSGEDGTILQYRGFIDRGARLEARFSGRPIQIRGSVMFQMRDGSVDYFMDMLPFNYKTGKTKFVMTKAPEDDKV